MTGNRIAKHHHATFEGIKQTDDEGNEFWLARELAPLLDYPQWRNFLPVLDKAREACRNSGQKVKDHFADVRKMVGIGSGALREVEDLRLSRYACYLVVQNGDPQQVGHRQRPDLFRPLDTAARTHRQQEICATQ